MKRKLESTFGLLALGAALMVSAPIQVSNLFVAQAEAIVGRPLTPVSYAGVARRTTRRAVVATSAATSVAYDQQQANYYNQQQTALPLGATLPSLLSGCNSTTVNNQSYFTCGGNWFRPAMQGSNIVYEVVAAPR